jgi:hypothetical protein
MFLPTTIEFDASHLAIAVAIGGVGQIRSERCFRSIIHPQVYKESLP